MSSLLLQFKTADILQLMQHTLAAAEHEPSFDQLYLAAHRKDGKDFPEDAEGFPKHEDCDYAKVPAGLWLVKDRGAYLMSNGRPGLLQPGGKSGAVVVYARGYGKNCPHIGGDDFVQFLDIQTFQKIAAAGAEVFLIKVTEYSVSIAY